MKAGELRHRVRIRQPKDVTVGSTGEPADKYYDVCEAWVAIDGVTGGERKQGVQIEAGITSLVRMRYRDDVKPTMHIQLGGRALNIVSAYDPDGRREQLHCQCREVVT